MTAEAGDATGFRVLQALPSVIQVGVPSATALRVQLVDEAGNSVSSPGVVVTATGVVSPGNRPPFVVTATSDEGGIVTFQLPSYVGALGNATITLTSPGLAPLALPPIAFVTGPVTTLLVATQPSPTTWSGAALPVQPVVQLSDAGDNPVQTAGVSVTAFIASGGGTLTGTTTVVTDANGTATFTDLALSGAAGVRTLGFSSQPLADVVSDAIDVASGAGSAVIRRWRTPADDGDRNGSALDVQGALVDASGLPVAAAGIPISISASSLSGATPATPLVGTLTRLTDAPASPLRRRGLQCAGGRLPAQCDVGSRGAALPVLTLVAALTLN